jgi:large subunit ribosomal protein L4
MKVLAIKSALNAKLNDNELFVLEALKIDSPKTKSFFAILKNLKVDTERVRFVIDSVDDNLKLACRNIERVRVDIDSNLNTHDALDCKKIVFTKNALQATQERVKKWLKQEVSTRS